MAAELWKEAWDYRCMSSILANYLTQASGGISETASGGALESSLELYAQTGKKGAKNIALHTATNSYTSADAPP
jgi:hypothetical protein